jgi:hypothetical protein
MTVTYHSGRRIQATSTDFGDNGAGIPAVSGGWKELGRISGTRALNASLTVSSVSDKRYYMVLYETIGGSGTYTSDIRLNADTGTNYAYRQSVDGATDVTQTSQTFINWDGAGSDEFKFGVGYFSNYSSKEKLAILHNARGNTVGATNAPARTEIVGKHAQTSNPITDFSLLNRGSNASGTGEIVVLGWDPDDTHTDNFWEELASVDLTGGANANLSSGTISAKKYLWVQYHTEPTSGTIDVKFTFNNDTGSNYADRRSINGSENTKINQDNWEDEGGLVAGETLFVNMFIINNASNEKLGIVHSVRALSGAGAGNAPQRREWVAKWANTSSQITEIDLTASSSTLKENSYLRVWGAD